MSTKTVAELRNDLKCFEVLTFGVDMRRRKKHFQMSFFPWYLHHKVLSWLYNNPFSLHNFRKMKIWQRSMDLVAKVYNKTRLFPKEETYGITRQIRRSAVSIPSNISEGAGRNTDSQFKYFLEISMGSCNELQTQIELSRRLKYLSDPEANQLIDEAFQIYRMILTYYNKL